MITHPDKVMFPGDGVTKGELAAYYEAIAPVMLPHVRGRPITMERYHRGIEEKGFFQKDVTRGAPEWLERVEVPKKNGTVRHVIVSEARGLVWLANQNCITPHVWTSRAPRLDRPDICVFDLDPPDENRERLRRAALWVRDLLQEIGLESWIKTSGSKGVHVAVPLDGEAGLGEVGRFAHTVGRLLVARHPDHLTQEFSKAERGGRILVDTGRNAYGATFAAVYAVRPTPGAPVSAPCSWDEIERGAAGPRTFTLRGMARRVADAGDLWAGLLQHGYSLREPVERLRRIGGGRMA